MSFLTSVTGADYEADGEGFEPSNACALPVFKCGGYAPGVCLLVPHRVLLSGFEGSDITARPRSSLPILWR